MNAQLKFHAYVTGVTVTVMYFVIERGVPTLAGLYPSLAQYLAPVMALLLSVGVYKTLASVLLKVTRRWSLVKRFLLSASYVNGTWVGKFTDENGALVYTVEHFEQDLSTLKIRGEGRWADDRWYADWESIAASIDEGAGKLTYIYSCQRHGLSGSFKGVCEFQFERADAHSVPTVIHGYSADLPDGMPIRNKERQVSNDLLPSDEAFKIARKKA